MPTNPLMPRHYRRAAHRFAIAAAALVIFPLTVHAQCAGRGGGGGGSGGAMAGGGMMPGMQGGGGQNSQIAFAMQMLQFQQQSMQQAQMEQMLRQQMLQQQMMSGGANGFGQPRFNLFQDGGFGGACEKEAMERAERPAGPLTEDQEHLWAKEEERQQRIEERIAEREAALAERLAAQQQRLAERRAQVAAND